MEEQEKRDSRLAPSEFDPSRAASTVVSHDSDEIEEQEIDEKDDEHHVDVNKAKAEFAALQRTLSSGREKADDRTLDLEKADDDFDLKDYFTSSNDANAAHGIRPKHVGVTWEDLRVEVPDIGHKVGSEFDAFGGGLCQLLFCRAVHCNLVRSCPL